MNPYEEQRLINEVVYLHGLWHQGPPGRQNPPFPAGHAPPVNRVPPPPQQQNPGFSRALSVSNTTKFKKHKGKKGKKKEEKTDIPGPDSAPVQDSGADWDHLVSGMTTVKQGASETSGWVDGNAAAAPPMPSISAEQIELLAALRMQRRLIKLCSEFFAEQDGSEEDDDDDEDDAEESEDEVSEDKVGGDDCCEGEEYKFFLKVFVENVGFREYYEKNYETGEFCCLVCGGKGGNKSFKGCLGLVQHSTTISKGERAHRALGRVVCEVLGWDFGRLPVIVSTGRPLRLSLANSGELEVAPQVNSDCEKKELDVSASLTGSVNGGNDGESKNDGNAEFFMGETSKPHQNGAENVVPKVEQEKNSDHDKTELVTEQSTNAGSDDRELDAGACNADLEAKAEVFQEEGATKRNEETP